MSKRPERHAVYPPGISPILRPRGRERVEPSSSPPPRHPVDPDAACLRHLAGRAAPGAARAARERERAHELRRAVRSTPARLGHLPGRVRAAAPLPPPSVGRGRRRSAHLAGRAAPSAARSVPACPEHQPGRVHAAASLPPSSAGRERRRSTPPTSSYRRRDGSGMARSHSTASAPSLAGDATLPQPRPDAHARARRRATAVGCARRRASAAGCARRRATAVGCACCRATAVGRRPSHVTRAAARLRGRPPHGRRQRAVGRSNAAGDATDGAACAR